MMMPSIFRENLFDDFMDGFTFPAFSDIDKALYGKHARNLMKTDVKETDTGYEVDIDLPGFKKEEVNASKRLDKDEKDKKTGTYIRKERYSGSCQRSFYVGDDITENDIKGSFKHGILKLTIPKKEAEPAVETKKYIAIEG